ncbi:membrane dipeptidase [Paenibacillus sp. DS2015]|uniref:dipeptidase n=1 Tax=Paenibacillus sp. DS2015 TaxID=3373917 RepID=UPI003D248729
MPSRWVDLHCDVLNKMTENAEISFLDDARLDITYERMQQGGIGLQCFAIYLSQHWGQPRFEYILNGIDIFRNRVLPTGDGLQWLRWKDEVEQVRDPKSLWGMLSIEGADGLEGNLFYVKTAFELGVRFLGVTWNYANWAADGILEQRNGGFTAKGRELIDLCHKMGMLLDVSHLSTAGFWELVELTQRPFIASHSNAYAICDHPRNLTDEQIKAIIALDGRMGLTFVPWFVKSGDATVKSEDILYHIEHMCSLGAEKHLMFGSDFDGIDTWIHGLEHPGQYPDFVELLLQHYTEAQVTAWISGNALTFLEQHLPERPSGVPKSLIE